jgi:heterodisulfide reductase subunit B
MKYAFFPGCSVHSSAREYGMSCDAVSKVLGIKLIEIPEWNCCSSVDAVYAYNPILSLSLAARNLALAEKMKMDIVTLCPACFLTLSRANKMLKEDATLKGQVNTVLKEIELNYNEGVKVKHYLDVLINDVGVKKISEKVKTPLKGLKVAPYYGCMIVRTPEIASFDHREHPMSLDKILEAVGATNVNYPDKTRCCGASLMVTKEKIAMEMTKNLLVNAKNLGANCIVTPCPMCHFNLDARQKEIESVFNINIGLPILYITQAIGLAFGLSHEKLGLKMNCISPLKMLPT